MKQTTEITIVIEHDKHTFISNPVEVHCDRAADFDSTVTVTSSDYTFNETKTKLPPTAPCPPLQRAPARLRSQTKLSLRAASRSQKGMKTITLTDRQHATLLAVLAMFQVEE